MVRRFVLDTMMITPTRQRVDFPDSLGIDDKISIFSENKDKWQLHIAELILDGGEDLQHTKIPSIYGAGFAALYIVLSYFEMIGKYEAGFIPENKYKQESEKYFLAGVYAVYPDLRRTVSPGLVDKLKVLYAQVRCGLYHIGAIGGKIILTGSIPCSLFFCRKENEGATTVVTETEDGPFLVINPHRLVKELRAHLAHYIDRLKDVRNDQLRENFLKRFDFNDEGLR